MSQRNGIGPHRFISLSPMPDVTKEELALSARAGVAGTAVWKTGKRGKPFTVRSVVDCVDLTEAYLKYNDYCALLGEGQQEVYWANDIVSPNGMMFIVIGVRHVDIRQVIASEGGLLGTDGGARLVCDWDLLPVDM